VPIGPAKPISRLASCVLLRRAAQQAAPAGAVTPRQQFLFPIVRRQQRCGSAHNSANASDFET
jgi:hypothetical protein